jgi:thioredoxin reductase/Pyruvate/2-oxoacid:ferredoxin oxidoreductase delta subunit
MFLLQFLIDNFYLSVVLFMALVLAVQFVRKEKKHAKAKLKMAKSKAAGTDLPNTLHPVIDATKCGGCAACTVVCPEGDILQMIDGKAQLINGSKCVGHGECQRACPLDAIDLVFGTLEKGVDIPNLSKDYETNMPNVYIAGELGGMGLIRNAVKQGSWAAYHAIKKLDSKVKTDTDLFIIGAGPAGMSAALAAIEKKVSYILIDQNTFGGTVNNYPRNKIVMSYPADLPIVGKMKFSNNKVSKEDLLDFWSDAVQKAKIKIHNSTKFIKYKDEGQFFTIETDKKTWTAKKIILAMGSGGLPMKLGLKNEDSPKVFYNLKDPDSYKKQHVVVVGGGNSAVEAAQYLGAKKLGNKVRLLVRGKALSRTNEDNVTIINKMQSEGLVEICYETSIKDIQPDKITIDTKGQLQEIKNDFIFVFAGNIKPYKQLGELGIKIETKFGEKIGK